MNKPEIKTDCGCKDRDAWRCCIKRGIIIISHCACECHKLESNS